MIAGKPRPVMLRPMSGLMRLAFSGAWWVVVLLGLGIVLLPFTWALSSSFKFNQDIFRDTVPFSWSAFIPAPFTDEAYRAIFREGFGKAMINSFVVAALTLALGILINSMAGFAFAKLKFPAKPLLFVVVLLTFSVPFEAIAIPLFIFVRRLGWYDTYQALIIPAVANGLVILLYRQFFVGIPDELAEAARVDGASWWRIYWSICMPVSKHVTVGAGLIMFLYQWNSFLWPLIIAPSPGLRVIQVAVARFVTEYTVLWNQQFAASVIAAAIPVMLILIFQRYFVSALSGLELK